MTEDLSLLRQPRKLDNFFKDRMLMQDILRVNDNSTAQYGIA